MTGHRELFGHDPDLALQVSYPQTGREFWRCRICGWGRIWDPERNRWATPPLAGGPQSGQHQANRQAKFRITPLEDGQGICYHCYFDINPCPEHDE